MRIKSLTATHASAPCPARAARRSDCGGWPKARIKARRIRAGSRKPVDSARVRSPRSRMPRCPRHLDPQPLDRLRRRGAGLGDEGAGEMPRAHAGLLGEVLHVSGASRCSRAQLSSGRSARRRLQLQQRGELRLTAAAAVMEHELAGGLSRDLLAEILRSAPAPDRYRH